MFCADIKRERWRRYGGECMLICTFLTLVVFSEREFTWPSGQEVAESETGSRKLLARMICTDWAGEYIKRTTTYTITAPGTVRVCK